MGREHMQKSPLDISRVIEKNPQIVKYESIRVDFVEWNCKIMEIILPFHRFVNLVW